MIKIFYFFIFSIYIASVCMLPVSELAGMHQLDEGLFDNNDTNKMLKYNKTICKDKKDGSLIADPMDRTLFYECAEGIAYPFHCPTGLIFNQNLMVCIVDIDDPSTQRPPIFNDNSTFNCTDKENNFYPDENDQSKFHECFNGHSYDYQCPTNLVFDLKHKACKFPMKMNNVNDNENNNNNNNNNEQRTIRETKESTTTSTEMEQSTEEQSSSIQRNRRSDEQQQQQQQQHQHHQLEDVAKDKHIDLHIIETTTNFDVWID